MAELISLPVEEYHFLCAAAEDLADLRSYDRAKAALALGDEELIPAKYVNGMLGGESSLRIWREYRRFTKTELAAASGVNCVQIVNIEAETKVGR